jgi:hypothetical protein
METFKTFKRRKEIKQKLDNDEVPTFKEVVELALIDYPDTRIDDTNLFTVVCEMYGIPDFETLRENPDVVRYETVTKYSRALKKENKEYCW